MKLRVVHFLRDPRPNVFSIERLYEDIRKALPADCEAIKWECENASKGVWPRLRDAWSASKAQGDVNHVTGDTHYLTYFLNRARTVLTVHDLITIERSRGLKRLFFWFFWFWLPVFRSRFVITVSEGTRRALIKSVRCDPAKVIVIHNNVSDEFQPAKKQFNVELPRILQVGTKPNKNLLRVVEALADIRCTLVIIGEIAPEVKGALTKHGVSYENYVGLTRAQLVSEYKMSDMLIFASTYEGFGLPIIEANAVGRPTVVSNLSPMTEVARNAACFVDPFDPISIRAGVNKVINDSKFRSSLVEAGFKNAYRFRSGAVAEKYAEVYRLLKE